MDSVGTGGASERAWPGTIRLALMRRETQIRCLGNYQRYGYSFIYFKKSIYYQLFGRLHYSEAPGARGPVWPQKNTG